MYVGWCHDFLLNEARNVRPQLEEPFNRDFELLQTDDVRALLRRYLAAVLTYVRSHIAEFASAALLAIMLLQMLAVISRKSITVDEIVMIPSAYYQLAAGNFELVNEHPPLSKLCAGIPLLFVQPNEKSPDTITNPSGGFGYKWEVEEAFWLDNKERFGSISFWSRVPMIVLTVMLGVLIFCFARQLFGSLAAVLAVALFSLEPTVLAHGRVVQTDIPAALGYLLMFMMIYQYVRSPSFKYATLLGCAAGCAMLAKFSMLIAGPIVAIVFAVMLFLAGRRGLTKQAIAIQALAAAVTVLVVINAAYFFQHRSMNIAEYMWLRSEFRSSGQLVVFVTSFLSYFVPVDYVLGVLFQVVHNRAGHSAGFLGMYSQTGWWYYYPVAFTLKTTVPFLLLSLVALVWAGYRSVAKRDFRFVILSAGFLIYTVFVLFAKIDIGVRYFLPAYMFLFIIGGALLSHLLQTARGRSVTRVIVALLLCWIVIEAVRAYPNHMSYMNQLAFDHPHWWYLSDSNVEWGDDVPALASYLHAHGETSVRGAVLGGFIIPQFYGINYIEAMGRDLSEIQHTRYIAIGASALNGSTIPKRIKRDSTLTTADEAVNQFSAYRNRTPEAVFGNSIYLFRED